MKKQDKIINIFEKIIAEKDLVSWDQIKEEINNNNITIKNWMTEVRSVLQYFINNESLKRTDNLYNEDYIITKEQGAITK